MEVKEIRQLVAQRPFRPITFHLENGGSQVISHPEIIITESIVVAVDDDGEAVYITPEAITSIIYRKHSKPFARRGKVAARKR